MVVKDEEKDAATEEMLSEETYRSMKRYTREWRCEINGMSTSNEDESESEQDRYAIADRPQVASETPECINTRRETKSRLDDERGRVAQIEYMAFGSDSIVERKSTKSTLDAQGDEERCDMDTRRDEKGDTESRFDEERCDIESQLNESARFNDSKCDTETRFTGTDEESRDMNTLDEFSSSDDTVLFEYSRISHEEAPRSFLCDFQREDFLMITQMSTGSLSLIELEESGSLDGGRDSAAIISAEASRNSQITTWSPRAMLFGAADAPTVESSVKAGAIAGEEAEIQQEVRKALVQQDVILLPLPDKNVDEKVRKPATTEASCQESSNGNSGSDQVTPWSPKAILCGATVAPFDESTVDERTSADKKLSEETELQEELRKANDDDMPISTSKTVQQEVSLVPPDKPLTGIGVAEQVWEAATIEAAQSEKAVTPKTTADKELSEETELREELRKANDDDMPFSTSKTLQQEVSLVLPDKPLTGIGVAERMWKAATIEAARREKAVTPKTTAENIRDIVVDLLLVTSPRQTPKVLGDSTSLFNDVKADPQQMQDGLKVALRKRPAFSPISTRSPKPTTHKSDASQAIRDLCFVGDTAKLERIEATLLVETAARGSEKIYKGRPRIIIDRPFDEEASITLDVNQVVKANLEKQGNSYPSSDLIDLSGNVSAVPVSKTMSARHPVMTAAATEETRISVCGVWQVEEIKESVRDLRVWVTRGTSEPMTEEQSDSHHKEGDDAQADDTENAKKVRSLNNALKRAIQSPRRSYSAHKSGRNIETSNGTVCNLCIRGSQTDPFDSSLLAQIKIRTAQAPETEGAFQTRLDIHQQDVITPSGKTDISLPFDEPLRERSVRSTGASNDNGVVDDSTEPIMFEAGLFSFQALQVNHEFKYSVDHALPSTAIPRNAKLVVPSLKLLSLYPVLEAVLATHDTQTPKTTASQYGFCHLSESLHALQEWITLGSMCTSRTDYVKEQVTVNIAIKTRKLKQTANESRADSRIVEDLKQDSTPVSETAAVMNIEEGRTSPKTKVDLAETEAATEKVEERKTVPGSKVEDASSVLRAQESEVSLLTFESMELYALPSDEERMDKMAVAFEAQEYMITSPLGTTEITTPFEDEVGVKTKTGDEKRKSKMVVALERRMHEYTAFDVEQSKISSPIGYYGNHNSFEDEVGVKTKQGDEKRMDKMLVAPQSEYIASDVQKYMITSPLGTTEITTPLGDEAGVKAKTASRSTTNESNAFTDIRAGAVLSRVERKTDAKSEKDGISSEIQERLATSSLGSTEVTTISEGKDKTDVQEGSLLLEIQECTSTTAGSTELFALFDENYEEESVKLSSVDNSNDSIWISAWAAGDEVNKGPLSPKDLNVCPTDELEVRQDLGKAPLLDKPDLVGSTGFEVSERGIVSSTCFGTTNSKREDTPEDTVVCKTEEEEPKQEISTGDEHDRTAKSDFEVEESSASRNVDPSSIRSTEQEVAVAVDHEIVPLFAPSDEMVVGHPVPKMMTEESAPEAEPEAATTNDDGTCLIS